MKKLSFGAAVSNEQVNNVDPLSNASLGETIIDSGVENETKFDDINCSDEKEKISFGAEVKQFFLPMLSRLLQKKPTKVQDDTVPSRLDDVLNEPSTCVATLEVPVGDVVTNINQCTNCPVEVPPIVGNYDIEEEVEGEFNVGNEDINVVLLEEVGAVDIDLGISQELTSIGERATKPVPKKLTRALQPKPKQHANKTQTKKKVPSDKSTKKMKLQITKRGVLAKCSLQMTIHLLEKLLHLI
jgi:hypothetical protein